MKYLIVLIALLFFAACGGKETVASKSAAAFREAQQKGTAVGTDGHGDHQHPGSSAASAADTTMTAMDHSTMTGMDHSTMTGMDDSTMTGGPSMAGMDHSKMHPSGQSMAGMDHSKMQSSTQSMAGMDHSKMQSSTQSMAGMDHSKMHSSGQSMAGMDHSKMQPSGQSMAGMDHSKMQSSGQSMAGMDHSRMQSGQQPATGMDHSSMAGMQHGAAAAPASAPPATSAGINRLRPASTLKGDAFDAPAATAVSEAIKAQGGGHGGMEMRGITPGQDRENPPTPAPAFRDGPGAQGSTPVRQNATPAAVDHSQHGQAAPVAESVYTCPMHPEITSEKPGTCPKCGMALVKKK